MLQRKIGAKASKMKERNKKKENSSFVGRKRKRGRRKEEERRKWRDNRYKNENHCFVNHHHPNQIRDLFPRPCLVHQHQTEDRDIQEDTPISNHQS